MKKLLLLFIFLLVFCLPAYSLGSDKTMQIIMDSWVGYSIDDVMAQWGYPSDEKLIAGKKLYYWGNTHRRIIDDDTQYLICIRIFEVDDANKIIKWQWEGNNCPFALVGKYKKKWLNQASSYNKKN